MHLWENVLHGKGKNILVWHLNQSFAGVNPIKCQVQPPHTFLSSRISTDKLNLTTLATTGDFKFQLQSHELFTSLYLQRFYLYLQVLMKKIIR